MNDREQTDNLVEVKVTNFFSGGDQKREEILAQPEAFPSAVFGSTCVCLNDAEKADNKQKEYSTPA